MNFAASYPPQKKNITWTRSFPDPRAASNSIFRLEISSSLDVSCRACIALVGCCGSLAHGTAVEIIKRYNCGNNHRKLEYIYIYNPITSYNYG